MFKIVSMFFGRFSRQQAADNQLIPASKMRIQIIFRAGQGSDIRKNDDETTVKDCAMIRTQIKIFTPTF